MCYYFVPLHCRAYSTPLLRGGSTLLTFLPYCGENELVSHVTILSLILQFKHFVISYKVLEHFDSTVVFLDFVDCQLCKEDDP